MPDRRLALLDWDNTLRSGFTVIDWTAFLASRDEYDEFVATRISEAIESYYKHLITYANLSDLIANLYASGLVGQSVQQIQKSASEFTEKDRVNLFEFTPALLAFLADEQIDAFIVSGCPGEVLDAYSAFLAWSDYYALEAEHKNGYYTGKVAVDRANLKGKKEAVGEILGKGHAVLAAGDSVSDLPLFENAEVRLVFDNPKLLESEPDVRHLDPFRSVPEILESVREILAD